MNAEDSKEAPNRVGRSGASDGSLVTPPVDDHSTVSPLPFRCTGYVNRSHIADLDPASAETFQFPTEACLPPIA